MDPRDITKYVPEAVSVAKVAAASIPFTGIVKRMLGPAADELAEMWKDQVRLYRYQRQLKCVEKAEKIAKAAGFTPQAVPPKILFPLLEGASMEEDEDLHDMWAALLANAASATKDIVRPGFITLLSNMAPDEAVLLKLVPELEESMERLYNSVGKPSATQGGEGVEEPYRPAFVIHKEFLSNQNSNMQWLLDEFSKNIKGVRHKDQRAKKVLLGACAQELKAADLIYGGHKSDTCRYRLTARGRSFLEACQPPKLTPRARPRSKPKP